MDHKEKFIHRDLSWLNFNERVLEESIDSHNPLLERLKFLAIFVNNLDEFFAIRISGLKRLIDSGYNRKDRYGYYPQELFIEVKSRTDALLKRLYEIYNKTLKDLDKKEIFLHGFENLEPDQKKFAQRFFDNTIFPIITPMAVDQGRPFPVLPSKTIAFAVNLERKDETLLAIIPVPKNVPRILKLPSKDKESNFILVDEIIRQNIKAFFKGYKIINVTFFRVIKDGEVTIDEEYTPDLLKAIEDEVKRRSWGRVVSLEVEKGCSPELLETLCVGLGFPIEEVHHISSHLDLTYLFTLSASVIRPDLSFKSYVPAPLTYENIFAKVNEGDFILHLPYQSFYPTVDLIQKAAIDPNVLAIKMTLYRTNEDSNIINALKEAARNKKQVTVVVEIRARFDEQKNINWVRELEEEGCHVVYGIAGLKIHSKMTLIVRNEEGQIRRYVHLSSGNYNENTAKVYTDIGYFTSNEDFAKDISDVFNFITGYSIPTQWKRIIAAPTDLRKYFYEMIEREIHFQEKYKNGYIWAKMNSLEDTGIIEKLYQASQAGVKVRLIVRGICCLVPGIKDLSENIEVKSVVGRFLEHSRMYSFNNNNTPRFFLSSADWMERNFDRRVELLFEINKQEIKDNLFSIMKTYWKDNVKSRTLLADQSYQKEKVVDGNFNAQEFLIEMYGVTA